MVKLQQYLGGVAIEIREFLDLALAVKKKLDMAATMAESLYAAVLGMHTGVGMANDIGQKLAELEAVVL